MAWHRAGNKPLTEPVMIQSLMHKCLMFLFCFEVVCHWFLVEWYDLFNLILHHFTGILSNCMPYYQRSNSEWYGISVQIAKFMGPTWGPPGSSRPQMGPMLAPWTLLSGSWFLRTTTHSQVQTVAIILGIYCIYINLMHIFCIFCLTSYWVPR